MAEPAKMVKRNIILIVFIILFLLTFNLSVLGWRNGFFIQTLGNLSFSQIKTALSFFNNSQNKPELQESEISLIKDDSEKTSENKKVAESLKIKLYLESLNTSRNNEFTENIKIKSEYGLYASEIYFYFNPYYLETKSVSEGDFFNKDGEQTYSLYEINNTSGKIVFAVTRLGKVGNVNGEGNIARINFIAKKTGKTEIYIRNAKLTDDTLEQSKFDYETESGEIVIK